MTPELYAPTVHGYEDEEWIGHILFREFDLTAAYATSGEAFVTAPEIALALTMGAEIEILNAAVIPWIENSPRPFEVVIRELSARRVEHDKGTLQNEMFKQLGNSVYGKLGQGITGVSAYNTTTDRQEETRPSRITNPYLAAHVTGLIRALVSELIASAPNQWTVVSVTTDALITNAPLADIGFDGPVARHLAAVRERLTREPMTQAKFDGGRGLLEAKYEAARLLPWRTGGVATLSREWDFMPRVPAAMPDEKPKPKLARGGMREPRGTKDPNSWFVRQALLEPDHESE